MKTRTKTSLFFSGELKENSLLRNYCADQDWGLTAQSLLKFVAVPFEVKHPFDVVFFSSIRSYTYFISQINNSISAKLACVGQQTADKINEQNSLIAFAGESAGNPEAVAQEFKAWLGDRRVLFPVSRQSAGTIAKAIPENQKEVVICYETQLVEAVIPEHSIYVFTSPSNVDAFLLKNELPASAIAIAWGKTTEKRILEKGVVPKVVLHESTEEELVGVLQEI